MEAFTFYAIAILAIWFRYNLRMAQACLFVGKAISNTGSKTGYQDAITPPASTTITLVVWGLIVTVVAAGFATAGGATGIMLLIEFGLVSVASGVFLPKHDAGYWIRRIHASLVRRTADFARKNDRMRADAARSLAVLVEGHFRGKLFK